LDFVVYDRSGRAVAGYECKHGNARYGRIQRRKDAEIRKTYNSGAVSARTMMEDNSVSKQFSKTIAKVAALLGHTRRGNSIVKCYGDTFSVIFFQRDKYSTSSRVDFWCNVGGGSKLLHEHFQSIREPFQMVFDQCPFRIMSDLYCHPGRWTLTSATNTEETALSVVDCLNSMD